MREGVTLGPTPRQRLGGAAGALLVQGALLYALIVGLAVGHGRSVSDALKTFAVETPPPPPPVVTVPQPSHAHRAEGAAAPPALKAKATDVVAPKQPLPLPPPVVAAPKPGVGTAPQAGAAPFAGPGSGAGGEGDGTGSGGAGDGDGDGGDPPEYVGGQPRDSDLPPQLRDIGGTVKMRYIIGADGRMQDCRIRRSSGNAELDAATCAIAKRRMRFRPARDANGRPVQDYLDGEHVWSARRVEPE